MTNKIYVGINNERVEATGELLVQVLQSQAIAQELTEKREAKNQAKVAAQAKLTALGLTVEDLQALGL